MRGTPPRDRVAFGVLVDGAGRLADGAGGDDIADGNRAGQHGRGVLARRLAYVAARERHERSRSAASRAVDADDGADGATDPEPPSRDGGQGECREDKPDPPPWLVMIVRRTRRGGAHAESLLRRTRIFPT